MVRRNLILPTLECMHQRFRRSHMLDVDYLILGYDMSDDGVVTIKDVWLKKVWQIA